LLNHDHEQDWIEKYRAALVQPPVSVGSRLIAALNTLAKALGSAIGRTSGKPVDAAESTAISTHSFASDREHLKQQGMSKKSSPSEHNQDKKAS